MIYSSRWCTARKFVDVIRSISFYGKMPTNAIQFWKQRPTYKKKGPRIPIKDLWISYNWKYRNKKLKARLILQSEIYISFTNISECTAFLLQGLTYKPNDDSKTVSCHPDDHWVNLLIKWLFEWQNSILRTSAASE